MRIQHLLTQMSANIKANWKSALSVALVSVPLSLSLGIASGVGPVLGIVTAVWAGCIAGFFGGSHFNIVGPAGALSGILIAYAMQYGPAMIPLIAVVAGVCILIIWALRLDSYLVFVPSSVIHGFTLGVALTIALGQLNFALGIQGIPTHGRVWQNVFETVRHISQAQISSVIVFLISIGAMIGSARLKIKIPNTVIVAFLGMIAGALLSHTSITVPTLFSKYGSLSLTLFSFPSLQAFSNVAVILQAGVIVAFVVVLETLLSAKIADTVTKTKFDQRKEVFGVGLANIVTGIFGGIPASGVFARTSINIRSGAVSRWSQILNAVFVASIALICLPYVGYLPLPVIAAILMYAAMRMVQLEHFRKLYRYDTVAVYIALTIAVITIFYDATDGILVGALLALLVFARRISAPHAHCVCDTDGVHTYHVAGGLNYLNTKKHLERMSGIDTSHTIVLDFTHAFYIDADGMEGVEEIVEYFEQQGKRVVIRGVSEVLQPLFLLHEWYEKEPSHNLRHVA